VNSAIFSPTGGSVGIGFAIPASTAKSVTDQLIRSGAIERGYIGVQIRNLTDDLKAAVGLPADAKGAMVESVTAGGPAERGGVRAADVIISVNGQAVETSNALTRAVGAVSVGSDLRIELFRDGRRQTVTVKSAKRPSEAELYPEDDEGNPRVPTPGPTAPSGLTVEGINLSALSPALKRRYSLADDVNEGLVVTEVAPRSKAAEIGMPAGTVITKAFGRAVTTPQDFKAAVDAARAAGRSHVLLSVVVNGSARLVPLELSKAE
jgi:serine protease Do